MAVSYDYGWADEHDLLVTQPYLAGSVMRVVRPDAGAGETAAVVTGTYLENEVRLKYPALRTAGYATYTDCMASPPEAWVLISSPLEKAKRVMLTASFCASVLLTIWPGWTETSSASFSTSSCTRLPLSWPRCSC